MVKGMRIHNTLACLHPQAEKGKLSCSTCESENQFSGRDSELHSTVYYDQLVFSLKMKSYKSTAV